VINIWWDGHDSRTRAYFFWKWEYDRRNETYHGDYYSALRTGKPSPEHFHQVYKHVHFDPAEGPDVFDILAAALMSHGHYPFEPYPPDDLYLDETGVDGHHDEEESLAFIVSENSLMFRLNPNLDLATHRTVLEDNFQDMVEYKKLFRGESPQRVIPLAGLRRLYVPEGYRQRDNHLGRAIGLALYDLTLKGMSWGEVVGNLDAHFGDFSITDIDENKLRRYLRATRTCVATPEVLPLG
jgi:hypothetical protein